MDYWVRFFKANKQVSNRVPFVSNHEIHSKSPLPIPREGEIVSFPDDEIRGVVVTVEHEYQEKNPVTQQPAWFVQVYLKRRKES